MSNSVDPSKRGGGFMGMIRGLPGKVNAMWNRKKVSNESSSDPSKLSQLKSKISSKFHKKESVAPDVSLKGKPIKKATIDKQKTSFMNRIQNLLRKDNAKTEPNSDQTTPGAPIDYSKFNKRWDHMSPSVREEFSQRSNDKEFILKVAQQNSDPSAWLLRAGDNIKNDPTFVAEALKMDPAFAERRKSFEAITPEVLKHEKVAAQFRENIKYQNRGFSQNANAAKNLQFVPFDIAREFLEEHPEAFMFANDTVRGDPETVKEVLKNDPKQIEFVNWDEMSPEEYKDIMQAHTDLERLPAHYQFAPREWIAKNIEKVESDLKTYNSQDALQRIALKLSRAGYDTNRFVSLAKENQNLFEALIKARLLSYNDVRGIISEKKEFESNVALNYIKEAVMKGE